MPPAFRPAFVPALVATLGLGLISGCGTQDAGFHVYTEPTKAEAPVVADQDSPTPGSGVVPASAQTTKPLPEVAVLTPQKTAPAVDETDTGVTGPVSIGSALPSDPVVSGEPPAVPKPTSPELALLIPPAPPAAVAIASLTPQPQTSLLPASQLELLIPEKSFPVEGSDGTLRVSFDDIDLLKVLNANPVPLDVEQHLPGWLSGLHGKTVRIRGWMYPPTSESGLRGFLFVRDDKDCCFGRNVLMYDKIGVRMRTGETTHYIQGHPFDVAGRMVVKSVILDGKLVLLYGIEDAVVINK